MRCFVVLSQSAAQTRRWGRRLGKILRGGEILGLSGELGSGKTCFVRGLAEGMGVAKESWVRSPSFTLINEYEGRVPLIHVDLFRVAAGQEMKELHLEEYFFDKVVSVVEWFDRLPADEVDEHLAVAFEHGGGSRRKLTFTGHGLPYEEIVERLRILKPQV